MKKLLITLTLILFITLAVDAQDYRAGIGFRGGPSLGLTGKYFISPEKALEGLLLARWGGYHVTGLYEIHAQAFVVNGLFWYYGFGGHFGAFHGEAGNKHYPKDKDYKVLGVDGILGMEYNFGQLPFNISLDFKPSLNLTGGELFWPDELALSIRYVWGTR